MALPEKITHDALLGGQVTLRQHAAGYRVAMDPVLLAASVPATGGEAVLDVGAGAGAAMLCLAWRVPGIRITGVEVQSELVHLAVENIADNGLGERLEVMVGDLQRPPPRMVPRSFDHVMANPPYFEAGRVRASGKDEKATANIEGAGGLGAWVAYCLSMVRPGGTITMTHRTDRLAELLALLGGKTGDLVIFPLWPHDPFATEGTAEGPREGQRESASEDGRASMRGGVRDAAKGTKSAANNIADGDDAEPPVAAKRVIVQATAGSKGPLRLSAGLVLHKANGNPTKAANSVLRHGNALML
ncbi:MAG: methyltransferase [Proteobacteria bacterium]|nr:methyltransferase [Pseudomonadota bacterium]